MPVYIHISHMLIQNYSESIITNSYLIRHCYHCYKAKPINATFFLSCFLEAGSHCVAPASLEPAM